jgi:hypothetical protein
MSNIITAKQFGSYLERNQYPLWVAINHHRTHTNKRMTMVGHYYLKPILMDHSRKKTIKKSTQGGVSETLIIISWCAANQGNVVFYVLPTHQLMERFVSNRYEKSLMFSPYYREQRTSGRSKEFKKEIIDNRSLKDIGKGVINFAGSKSDVPFIEIPADWFVVDEADQCDPNRLQMGLERLGHSDDPHELYVGNPSFIGSFLDNKFEESTKEYWHVKADCGHRIKIDFFEHVVRQIDEFDYIIRDKDFEVGMGHDVRPICDVCEKPFNRFNYGEYVKEQNSDITGKHISRLFSGSSSLYNLVSNFSKALEDDYKMQRFYNSDLGESFTAAGSKITLEALRECCGDYLIPSKSPGPCIMGVDVGNQLHVRINKLIPGGLKQAVYIGTVSELTEVYTLCKIYKVIAAVMDALPEIRMARKFSHSHGGRFRCFFGGDKMDTVNLKEKTATVSRTMIIDTMKEMIIKKEIIFPKNIENYDEYVSHMQAPVRVWDEEKEEYVWESNKADHFFFAETYCKLAEQIIKFIT